MLGSCSLVYTTLYGCGTMNNGEKCKSRIMLPFPQFRFVCFNFYANGRWAKSMKLLSDTVLTYRRRWKTKRCYIFTAAFHPFTCHEGAVNEEQTNAWTKRNMPLENIRITFFLFDLWQCCSYIHLLLRVTRGRGERMQCCGEILMILSLQYVRFGLFSEGKEGIK